MSTPREILLGTKTASIPSLPEAAAGFFSHYVPENDTFDGRKNNVQVGIRPSWVLQARELTEIQSVLRNQFRLMVEGDEIKINTPFAESDATTNLISYGGVRGGWSNPNRFTARYEVTTDFVNDVPESVVDKYNAVYGAIDVDGVVHGGVGDWLRVTPYSHEDDEIVTYPNFKDFKRITFGPGGLYVVSQHGLLPYFAHIEEEYTIDLYGWWPSRRGYAGGVDDGDNIQRDYVDPDGDGTYPPNEENANGSGGVNSGMPVGRRSGQPLGELIEQFPDVTYFMGLSSTETLVKPGVSSKTDRFLLDNAAGYNNHEAPGAYRIKHFIMGEGTGDYIPVFTGELTPRALSLFNSLVNFPWDGGWGGRWQEIKDKLESTDHLIEGQAEVIQFIADLGFEPKEGDEERLDATKRVVMYRYPSVEDYYNIFKKYGIRRIFTDTENHLDDREKNRLLLNPNSVVWDYRLIDPEYLQGGGYLPQDPSIGNGLIETYLTSPEYESLFGFALGTNSSSADGLDGDDTTDCGPNIYHWFSKNDPMYIPYVSTSKYGIIGNNCGGSEEGSFLEDYLGGSLQQTRLHIIQSLTRNALKTDKEINFLPLLHFSYNMFNKLLNYQIYEENNNLNGEDTVFDMREMRFIIPPAPTWDWTNRDEYNEPIPYEWYVYSAPYNELLPWQAYNTATYFNNETPYSWTPAG